VKGTLLLKHSVGLGPKPNVIPEGEASVSGELRPVQIGWHPVAGLGGKWFAEQTGLGKKITEKINHYPDPTQHWAVLVAGYVHQLWMVSIAPQRTPCRCQRYFLVFHTHLTRPGREFGCYLHQ
jgi:hypothetical protein